MIRNISSLLAVVIISGLLLSSCAGMGAKPLAQLTVAQIVESDLKEIDLRGSQLVCTGKKVENLDQVEGVMVKGVLCEEAEHVSFLYLFNGEPFFFAILRINNGRDQLTPLMGFGAMEQRGLMLPVDLKSRPRLPAWAYGNDGKPFESIYKEQDMPVSDATQGFR